jgi:hypothetical protein
MRASTSKVIDEGKRVAHAEADKVRGALKLQSAEIAREIASRVLGRDVQP